MCRRGTLTFRPLEEYGHDDNNKLPPASRKRPGGAAPKAVTFGATRTLTMHTACLPRQGGASTTRRNHMIDNQTDHDGIRLTWEQRNMLRHEAVLALSGDAIGDYVDNPGQLEWALQKRSEHEIAFQILDDLGWSPDATSREYLVHRHDGLSAWLQGVIDGEKRVLRDEQRVLVDVRAGIPDSIGPDEIPEHVEATLATSCDESLDLIGFLLWLLSEVDG